MVSLKRIFLSLILIFSSSVVFAITIDGPIIELQNCAGGSSQFRPKNTCDTEEKKCCGSGFLSYWSEWGQSCPTESDCNWNECWNGSACAVKPSDSCSCTNGSCSKTYTCSSGFGWQGKEECSCYQGYVKKNGACVKDGCDLTCNGANFLEEISGSCNCCSIGCYQVSGSIQAYCNCTSAQINYSGTCCYGQMGGGSYRLPKSVPSCGQLGNILGTFFMAGACVTDR